MTVYRLPKQCTSFILDFSELLTIIDTTYERVIMSGDFNVHMDNQSDTYTYHGIFKPTAL